MQIVLLGVAAVAFVAALRGPKYIGLSFYGLADEELPTAMTAFERALFRAVPFALLFVSGWAGYAATETLSMAYGGAVELVLIRGLIVGAPAGLVACFWLDRHCRTIVEEEVRSRVITHGHLLAEQVL